MKKLAKAKSQRPNGLNPFFEEQIEKLSYDIMRSRGGNIFLNEDTVITIDIMPLIQYILMKKSKSKEDRDVIIEYLKSLENFMSLLNINTSQDLFNEMLIRLSKNLLLQDSPQHSILFHTGDKGSLFYIIIKGSVSVLIPRMIKAQMTPDEYLEHLCFLNQLEENELQSLTAESNKETYDINLSDSKNPDIVNMANKALDSYKKRSFSYHSVDEYINCLIPQTTKEDNYYYPYVSVWIYHKVVELSKGNTFGENALLSRSALRTATIYINEDTIFGTLNEMEFNMTLKTLQIQNKKDCISFVLSFNLFSELNFEVFSRRFWNNFTQIRLKQGECLFQQFEKRDLVYLCKEGEFELSSKLSIADIDSLLKHFGEKKPIGERNREKAKKRKKVRIACVKNRIIIGLEDLIDETNHFACSATCISKKAEVFAVNLQVFHEIIDYAGTYCLYKAMIKEKIELMINRLKTFQQVENFILKKDPHSIIKTKLMPVFIDHQLQGIIKQRKSCFLMNNSTIPIEIPTTITTKRPSEKKGVLALTKDITNGLMTPKISLSNTQKASKHFGLNYHLRPSIKEKIKYSICKEVKRSSHINKTMCDTIVFEKVNKTITRRSVKASQRIWLNNSTDNELEQQFNKLKRTIDENPIDKQLIYSNLTLNPNYTLNTKCGVSNIMDYCIMEKGKDRLLNDSTVRKQIKLSLKQKNQNAIRLCYGSKKELENFISRTE